MFRNTFVSGFVSLFFSVGSKPLQLWRVVNPPATNPVDPENPPVVRFVKDEELGSQVLELLDPSVITRIECPANTSESLAIRNMPYLVLQVRNLGSFFSFEIEVLDSEKKTRRFRCSNFQLDTKLKDEICVMPLVLAAEHWNTVQLDLRQMLAKAYGTQLVEFSGIVIHANIRLRRVYLCESLVSEENLPNELKLFKAPN